MIRSSKRVGKLGQGLTEYLLVVGVVAILLVPAIRSFSGSHAEAFGAANDKVEQIAEGHVPLVGTSPRETGTSPSETGTSPDGPGTSSPNESDPGSEALASHNPALAIHGATFTGGNGVSTTQLSSNFAPPLTPFPTFGSHPTSPAPNPGTGSSPGSGTGVTAHPKGAKLGWDASTSPDVTGYNLYRSTVPGSAYIKITATPVTSTTYLDTTVQSGITYYYVSTAVDAAGLESTYSNQATFTAP